MDSGFLIRVPLNILPEYWVGLLEEEIATKGLDEECETPERLEFSVEYGMTPEIVVKNAKALRMLNKLISDLRESVKQINQKYMFSQMVLWAWFTALGLPRHRVYLWCQGWWTAEERLGHEGDKIAETYSFYEYLDENNKKRVTDSGVMSLFPSALNGEHA